MQTKLRVELLEDRETPSAISGLTNALTHVTANANTKSQAVVHVSDNLADWKAGEHTNHGKQ